MSRVDILCWNPACSGRHSLACLDHDQAIYCTSCREVRSFVNLGAIACPDCEHLNRVPLNNWDLVAPHLRCENCRGPIADTEAMRVYHLGQYMQDELGGGSEVSGCYSQCFEGMEDDAKRGKDALGRLARDSRRTVYVHQSQDLYVGAPNLPIERLQNYHVCCNFKISPGEDTKFVGTLASFAQPDLLDLPKSPLDYLLRPSQSAHSKPVFDYLLEDCKVKTVWFATAAARQEFMTVPPFAARKGCFRTE